MDSQRGDASTLFILSSLVVIALGTTIGMTSNLGSLRNRFTKAQENVGCPYHAEAVVVKQDSSTPLLVSENGTTDNYGVANDFNLRKNPGKATGTFGRYDRNNDQIYDYFDDKPIDYSGTDINIISKYVYHNDHLVFAPNEGAGVVDGQIISVTLFGLDDTKWKITGQFCEQLKGSTKGCPTDLDKTSTSNTMVRLRPTCGTNIRYGWTVAPQDGEVVKPTGTEGDKCELDREGCEPKEPTLTFLSRNRFRISWENPTSPEDSSSCPALKFSEDTVKVDIHQGGVGDNIICSKTVSYDKDDTATNCVPNSPETKLIKGQKYTATIRTSSDSSCLSPVASSEATYEGSVRVPTDKPNDDEKDEAFNTFALNVWNSDKFVSPGDNHLCWSVGNNQGLNNIKKNTSGDYECNGMVTRNSSEKVDKLSVCYKNKTGTDARVGWQVHRCKDNQNNCVQENTGSDGDRIEEASDLKKLSNNKWYKCTWNVKNLKNPNTITLDECEINLDSCSFSSEEPEQKPEPSPAPEPPNPTKTPIPPKSSLPYTIKIRSPNIIPSEENRAKVMSARPKAVARHYDTIVETSVNRGWNPALILAIWLEETGGSRTTLEKYEGAGLGNSLEHLGCSQNTGQKMKENLDCVFNGSLRKNLEDHEFDKFMASYCGPNEKPTCSGHKRFVDVMGSIYNQLIPPGETGAMRTLNLDVNNDGTVNTLDYVRVTNKHGQKNADISEDVTGDFTIDSRDTSSILERLGASNKLVL